LVSLETAVNMAGIGSNPDAMMDYFTEESFVEQLKPYGNKELRSALTEFGCGQSAIRKEIIFSLWAKADDDQDVMADILTFLKVKKESRDAVSSSQLERQQQIDLENTKLQIEKEKVALETLKVQASTNRNPTDLEHELKLAQIESEK